MNLHHEITANLRAKPIVLASETDESGSLAHHKCMCCLALNMGVHSYTATMCDDHGRLHCVTAMGETTIPPTLSNRIYCCPPEDICSMHQNMSAE